MEYLIFSDSHGKGRGMELALERQITRPRGIWFAGDGLRDVTRAELGGIGLEYVSGNCDMFSAPDIYAPEELLLSVGSHRVLLTHGHLYGVKSGYGRLMLRAVEQGADIAVFGHTHEPFLMEIPAGETVGFTELTRPLYLFNPGSIGHGGSFGVLTLQDDKVLLSHGRI